MDDESELQLYDHIDFSEASVDNTLKRHTNDGNARRQHVKRLPPKKAAQAQVRLLLN